MNDDVLLILSVALTWIALALLYALAPWGAMIGYAWVWGFGAACFLALALAIALRRRGAGPR